MNIDWTIEPDPGRVGDIALDLAERIRDEDPREIFDEVTNLAHRHPRRFAQLLVSLAALVDPSESLERMNQRLAGVVANRVEVVRLGRRRVS